MAERGPQEGPSASTMSSITGWLVRQLSPLYPDPDPSPDSIQPGAAAAERREDGQGASGEVYSSATDVPWPQGAGEPGQQQAGKPGAGAAQGLELFDPLLRTPMPTHNATAQNGPSRTPRPQQDAATATSTIASATASGPGSETPSPFATSIGSSKGKTSKVVTFASPSRSPVAAATAPALPTNTATASAAPFTKGQKIRFGKKGALPPLASAATKPARGPPAMTVRFRGGAVASPGKKVGLFPRAAGFPGAPAAGPTVFPVTGQGAGRTGVPGFPVSGAQAPTDPMLQSAFMYKGTNITGNAFISTDDGQRFKVTKKDFDVICQVGHGAHGNVYKVRHRASGTLMAMKEIELTSSSDDDQGERITMELEVLRKGSASPHIVNYYGVLYSQSCVYILMQYMDRGALDGLLELPGVDRVPEVILGKIGEACLKGLIFMEQELHIMHRDVKPSNVLMNSAGEIKFCDFSVSGALVLSRVKTYVGTMHYMAPERIDPPADKEYSVLADVWSLGITLVELATGRHPYPRDSQVFQVLQHIVQGSIPTRKPEFRDSCFSADFVAFLEKCLQKDPQDRAPLRELMTDPFIVRCSQDPTSFAGWLKGHQPAPAGSQPPEA